MRLLLVEDAPDLADALLRYLRADGHAVDAVSNTADARAALRVADYAAVLLDLGLPDGSGLELLREERARGNRTPVVIVTSRDRISDRIAGLDAGADDYVVKPFDLGEIAARIRASARRAGGAPSTEILLGPIRVDRARASVWRDGLQVHLTSREWSVLDALLAARGRVLAKPALEEALYSFDDEIAGNAVEVYVSRLRSKLGNDIIETRRGLGYLVP
jgi:two-component system OmpR family response regulator